MLRSMFTAISALNLHQEFLDTVANNLANANTTGFKSARVLFQDQFSQLLSPGAGPTAALGGVDPTQIGLGVKSGFISPVFTQGALQSTGRNLDLAVQGDGFFIYDQGASRRYSREGALELDSGGNLVNASTGLRVQGWPYDPATGSIDTNAATQNINIVTDRTLANPTGTAVFGGNLNSNTPQVAPNNVVTTTMGIYDSLGNPITVTVDFTRTNDTNWTWAVTDPPTAAGDGTIVFDNAGQYSSSTVGTAISVPGGPGSTAVTPAFDLTKITMLAMGNSATVTTQDGLAAGTVSDIFVTPNDGSVFLVYSNGMRQQVAQVALARFANSAGLMRAGNTMFQQGLNSGDPQIGTANTGGRGSIASGYLEASNVDMAQEFTNMILAQRGFQASSRVITTSDEILQELVNLKR